MAGTRRLDVLCAVAGVFVGAAAALSVFGAFENFASDWLVSQHAVGRAPRNDLVILAIDDQSTADLPFQSPLSRKLLASVLRELDKRGAAVIGLDILLDRPSDPADDADLAAAIGASRARIVLGRDPGEKAAASCAGQAVDHPHANPILPAFAANAITASVTLCLDGDGVVRRMPIRTQADDPLFSGAIAAGLPPGPGKKPARADGRPIPFAMTRERDLTIPTYSAAALPLLPDDFIRGKAVLVGAVLPYSGDWFATPLRFAEPMQPIEPRGLMPRQRLPGVTVHAFQAAALIDRAQGASRSLLAVLGLALAGGAAGAALGGATIGWRLRAAAAIGLVVADFAVVTAVGVYAGVLLPLTPFVVAAWTAGGLVAAVHEARQRREKREVRRAFEHYLAPAIVEALVRDPALVAAGAAEREISVLFTDLAGFSTFVDTTPPGTVREIINGYLSVVMDIVVAHDGMIDKIVGDAIHALFSAPTPDPDHRLKAVRCALAIDSACEAYRVEVRERFGVSIGATRIGVHSGRALVGNFGGGGRLDYTAHGSTINATARLEQANKMFGTRICVSAVARVDAPDLRYRQIAEVRLRGIEAPMLTYEPAPADARAEDEFTAYAAGVAAMRERPQEARDILAALAAQRPDEALVRFQLQRIANGVETGPLSV